MGLPESISNRLLQNGSRLLCKLFENTIILTCSIGQNKQLHTKDHSVGTFSSAMMSGERWNAANKKSDSFFLTYKDVITRNLFSIIQIYHQNKYKCCEQITKPNPDMHMNNMW